MGEFVVTVGVLAVLFYLGAVKEWLSDRRNRSYGPRRRYYE